MRRAATPPKTTRDFWILWIVRNRQALMSSKKKSRPLFEVPVEIGSGGESGWVYRSGTPEKDEGPRPRQSDTDSESSEKSIGAESMHVLTLAFTTLAHTF